MMNIFRFRVLAGLAAVALLFGAVAGCNVNGTQGATDDSKKAEGEKDESKKPEGEKDDSNKAAKAHLVGNPWRNSAGTSSHISWKSSDPESSLKTATIKIGCEMRELKSQTWDQKTATIDGIRDTKLCSFLPARMEWSFLLLHLRSLVAEPLALELSKSSNGPVIVFHEFEEVAWGFAVFEGGKPIARFWNRPAAVDEKPGDCMPNVELLAKQFGVSPKALSPYLRHFGADVEYNSKAYADDRFSLGDHWVRVDFMKRLVMHYADPKEVGARHIYVHERGVN